MIRINLASRKQAVAVDSTGSQSGTRGGFTHAVKFDARLDSLRELPLQKIALLVVALLGSNYGLGHWKEQRLQEIEETLVGLRSAQSRLQAEVGKARGYEAAKTALEADEAMIRTKIATVEKLIQDRQTPPKLLFAVSESLPAELWLNQFSVEGEQVKLDGYSADYNQISDLMKNIGESSYFSDVKLLDTQQARDDVGETVASFSIEAKRKLTQ